MEIRKLDLKDFDDFLRLEGYAFHYVTDEERTKKVRKIWENSIPMGAVSDEGELQSALLIRPYRIFLHGRRVKMGGIGDVASYPEVRGQGNIRKLFHETLIEMKNQGMVLSYLAPFSYAFYRKFGYELIIENREYTIKPSEFSSLNPQNRIVRRVEWEEAKDTLMSLYTQKYRDTAGPVDRKEWAWQEKEWRVKEAYYALCINELGEPEGYISYSFQSKDTYIFKIEEVVAMTGEAEKALWRFISSHSPQFHLFTYRTGASQNLAHLFNEPTVEQKWSSGMMARIVDMEEFLKQYPFKQDQDQTFYLEVTGDNTAEWNNGTYKVEVNPENIRIQKTTAEETTRSSLLTADIQTWTQLFMGSRTPEQLHFQGNLYAETRAVEQLQKMISNNLPELYDYF